MLLFLFQIIFLYFFFDFLLFRLRLLFVKVRKVNQKRWWQSAKPNWTRWAGGGGIPAANLKRTVECQKIGGILFMECPISSRRRRACSLFSCFYSLVSLLCCVFFYLSVFNFQCYCFCFILYFFNSFYYLLFSATLFVFVKVRKVNQKR